MKKKYYNILFYVVWVIFLFSRMMSFYSTVSLQNPILCKWFNRLFKLSIFAFVILGFLQNRKKTNWIFYIIGFTISLIVFYITKRNNLLFFIVVIFAIKGCEFDKIAKITLIELLITIFMINLMSIFGIIPNLVYLRDNKMRNACGFIYVLHFSGFIHETIFLLLYESLEQKKYKRILIYIFCILINIIVTIFTVARTHFFGNLLLVFITMVIQKFKFLNGKKMHRLIGILIIAFFAFSIVFSLAYKSKGSQHLLYEGTLNDRIVYTKEIIDDYDVKLFGNYIWMNGSAGLKIDNDNEYFYVDNIYVQLLYMYGLVSTVIITLCIVKKTKDLDEVDSQKARMIEIWVLIELALGIIIDNSLSLFFNIPILGLFTDRIEEENTKKC